MDKYTIELNAARKDSDYIQNRELNAKSPVVEVFSAMVEGKTLPNLGDRTDNRYGRTERHPPLHRRTAG